MRNYVMLRAPVGESNVWEQFTAMTAWSRERAIAKINPDFQTYRYMAIPARWWRWYLSNQDALEDGFVRENL